MELLYIWIEEYKNIKEQGFNFSSKHRFEFVPQKDDTGKITGGKLHHEENPNYIENFFGENITNVTAIIGENGAGKSTLIAFTRDIFVNSIFENSDGILCITKHNQTDEKYKIEGYPYLIKGLKFISKKENLFEKYFHNKSKNGGFSLPFAKTKVVINHNPPVLFYSNIYDGKREYYNDAPIVSVSTNYLIENEVMRSQDILRQLIFMEDNSNINIKFSLPDELRIDFNPIMIRLRISIDTENIIESYNTVLSKYILKSLMDRLCHALLIIFIGLFESSGSSWQERLLKILKKFQNQLLKGEESLGDITLAILKDYKLKYENSVLNKEIDAMLEMVDILKNDEKNNKIKPKQNEGFSIIYNIKDSAIRKNVERLLKNYQTIRNNKQGTFFLIMAWLNLSSGEIALLNLYSRIYSAVEAKKECKELVILIDEGETGFHPQWQKEYLKILIDFLPQIFPDKKIQIILTSHSPFLVSDLPKENIIFLSKNEKGKCVVSKLQDRKETFGANIHTLFTDSFFMKGGLMGTFAEKRINEVIAYLNGESAENSLFNGKISEEQQKLAEKYISMIGEPIIRNMLQKQLNSKRLEKVENHEERIKKLEEELAGLRKKS